MSDKKIKNEITFMVPFSAGQNHVYFIYTVQETFYSEVDGIKPQGISITIDVGFKNQATGNKLSILTFNRSAKLNCGYIGNCERNPADTVKRVESMWKRIFSMIRNINTMPIQQSDIEYIEDNIPLCYSVTECMRKNIVTFNLSFISSIAYLLEVNLVTLRGLLMKNKNNKTIAKHYKKIQQQLYFKSQPLSNEEEKLIKTFSLPVSRVVGNLWTKEYRIKLLKELLVAYREKAGMPFTIYTALTGINDKLDQQMLTFLYWLYPNHFVRAVQEFIGKELESEKFNVKRFVEEYNKKQIERLINAKGKLTGYRLGAIQIYKSDAVNSLLGDVIRLIPSDDVTYNKYDKSMLMVKDYPMWDTSVIQDIRSGKKQNNIISKDNLITYRDIIISGGIDI